MKPWPSTVQEFFLSLKPTSTFSASNCSHYSSPLLPTALLSKPLDVGIPDPLLAPWRALQDPFGNAELPPNSSELLEGLHGADPQSEPGMSHHHPIFRGEQQKSSRAVQTHLSSLEQPCLLPGSWSSGTTTSSSGSNVLMGDSSARTALPTQRHMEQQGNHQEKQQQSTTRKIHHQNTEAPPLRLLWNQTQIYYKKHYGIRGKKMTVPDPPN